MAGRDKQSDDLSPRDRQWRRIGRWLPWISLACVALILMSDRLIYVVPALVVVLTFIIWSLVMAVRARTLQRSARLRLVVFVLGLLVLMLIVAAVRLMDCLKSG